MHIIFFTHPGFHGSVSMPRFARMLAEGMKDRGHKVELWTPQPFFFKLPLSGTLKKWLGYIDQFILFPRQVRKRLKEYPSDSLFVFTDQALGPWVPLVADRFHVVHCHDFLAQRSALGEVEENRTRWTGRQYQAYIRRGYSEGENFISVSKKTKQDLHQLLPSSPLFSDVVYNGLNQLFAPYNSTEARAILSNRYKLDASSGYILHVGGNQWYKNRIGVIEIYNAWRSAGSLSLPLLLIGAAPNDRLRKLKAESPYKADIHFLRGVPDEDVRLAYAGASVFVFPSLAEGFGWPIAEAMASGCPVITTGEAPMTEVAGNAGFLIPRRPHKEPNAVVWAAEAAKVMNYVLNLSPAELEKSVKAGLINATRFDVGLTLDRIEQIYRSIASTENTYESTACHC